MEDDDRQDLILNRLHFIALLPLAATLSACEAVVLNPSGDIAVQLRDLVVISTTLMLLVMVPVMAFLIAVSPPVRRSRNRHEGAQSDAA